MAQAAWEKLYKELDSAASLLGYPPPRDLAKEGHASQCFQLEWKRLPVLYVGFRDLVKIDAYSSPDHIWVESFGPIFRAINSRIAEEENPFIPPAYGIVVDNSRDTYVLVPFSDLLRTYVDREKRRMVTVENQTFAVLHGDGAYLLETSYGSANLRIRYVGTIEPLVQILDRARDPATRRSIIDMFETTS